jgi:putative protease
MKIPELLAPAGSLAMLETALAFGATAIYAGQPRYSLRVRNNDFGDIAVLQQGIDTAHAKGAKFFLVSNIFPHGNKIRHYLDNMAPVIALQPDAMIMSDPGLIMMVRETWPEMEIHLSVQANTVNSAAVKFWKTVGIHRVILSRELSLDQVAEIRQACPDTELEVFVHGALCCALPIRVAACCRAISTTVMPTRAVAPTPAAGTTRRKKAWSTPRATC